MQLVIHDLKNSLSFTLLIEIWTLIDQPEAITMAKPLTRLHTNGLQGTFLKQEKLLLRVKHNRRYELKCSETTKGYLRLGLNFV